MLGLFFPMMAFSQTDVALDSEFGGRVSASVDKKITKGLHVSLEEEVRFDNNFGSLDRLQTTLGISYKVHPNIKLGLGYALINGYRANSESFKNPRHRFMADATGTLHLGNWNLSLKERFQVTRRTGDFNVYQNPQNALTLKSRLKAQYKGVGQVQPYAYFEKNTLNFYFLGDYLMDKVVDANAEGTKLKSYTKETGFRGWVGAGYEFAF